MEKIELFYPIYMDIPMMISFVAAMEGGYSLENAWKLTNDSSGEISGALEGEACTAPIRLDTNSVMLSEWWSAGFAAPSIGFQTRLE